MDLCAFRYEVNDPNVGDLVCVWMKTMFLLVKVGSNIFPTPR